MKLIYGHGINDLPGFCSDNQKLYDCWYGILKRCFDPKCQAQHPTYKDCTVCDEWLTLSNFVAWAKDWKPGLELDKDIICPGNKHYCPERCCFVSQALNSLLLDCGTTRGKYPIGVCYHKRNKAFRARVRINGKEKYLGLFNTIEEASNAYTKAKVQYITAIANKQTDPRIRDGFLLHAQNLQEKHAQS